MKIIGLTGGIASGKSTVNDFLRRNGAVVIDADEISRALTAPGGAALKNIRAVFGDAVFAGEVLDRKKLAQVIFSDAAQREKLNALIHPMVLAQMQKKTLEADAHGEAAVIWDVPLLFETGYDRFTDETWLVAAEESIQLKRLIARDDLTPSQAQSRIDTQMPLKRKRELADRILENNGTLAELEAQALLLWERAHAQ